MGKTEVELKEQTTYLNFDFDTVWRMDQEYPYFQEFHYVYLTDLEVVSEFNMEVGDAKKIEVQFS